MVSWFLLGCISAFTWAIGPIIIGRIQSRYKFKVKQALCVIVLIQLVAVLGFTSMMFLPCPAVEWAGHSASVNRYIKGGTGISNRYIKQDEIQSIVDYTLNERK